MRGSPFNEELPTAYRVESGVQRQEGMHRQGESGISPRDEKQPKTHGGMRTVTEVVNSFERARKHIKV